MRYLINPMVIIKKICIAVTHKKIIKESYHMNIILPKKKTLYTWSVDSVWCPVNIFSYEDFNFTGETMYTHMFKKHQIHEWTNKQVEHTVPREWSGRKSASCPQPVSPRILWLGTGKANAQQRPCPQRHKSLNTR